MACVPVLAVHGALARGAFAVVVLVSLAVLFAPASDVPSAPPGVDKLVHASLFAALALTGRWAGSAARCWPRCSSLYAGGQRGAAGPDRRGTPRSATGWPTSSACCSACWPGSWLARRALARLTGPP